jgi:hypothetical protein
MTGLRGNDDGRAALCDHLAEFLQDESGAVEIDFEDGLRRGLGRRNARRMDDAMNVAERARLRNKRLNRCTGRHVNCRRRHLKTRFAQRLCCSIRILLAEIGQQQVFACADTPSDGLADGTGTYNHYYFSHTFPSLFVGDVC